MKLKFLSKFLLGVLMVCGVMFFAACSDDDDAGNDGSLNGTWVKSGSDNLTINGNRFDFEGGQGTVSYKGLSITFTADGASSSVTGKYSLNADKNVVTITELPEGYTDLNGTWTKQQ